jgi:hypothetical protein
MDTFNLSGILEIPQSGARLYTIAGGAKTVAVIAIAPGGGLSSKWRRFAERNHEFIGCTVRADLGRPISPDVFHRTTLLWAIYSADLIQVSASSQRVHDFSDALAAADAGSRFHTTIETTEQDAPDWLRFIEGWRRNATPVRVVDRFALAISKL